MYQEFEGKNCSIRLSNIDSDSPAVAENPQNASEPDFWKFFDEDINRTRPENNTTAAIREFDKYLNEEYISRKMNPLEWWQERKKYILECIYLQ